MSDPQVLHELQAIDQVKLKPEFALLSKQYNVLYQSLIPNCKLTIKILRRHFTITDQVEQYILSGDSQRLCCQRVMNVLLVHLDIVKDYHQFCDWLDSVSVMGSLIDKIKTEFSASDKWGHRMSAQSKPVIRQRSSNTTHQHYTQPTNVEISDGVDQLDDSVMDNVIIRCTVNGEEALVDKACSCSGSRRRLVRHKVLVTTRQSKHALEINVKQKKIDHIKSLLNFRCLLNPSEWSIVNTCLPVLCESLPDDYQSTIEKLKALPQFLAAEQQQQLNSLIPTTLTDVKLINEKIITFIVITLSFCSGGMTKLCDIMDVLIESTNCVQEIRCVESNGTSSSLALLHPDSVTVSELKKTPGISCQPWLTIPSSVGMPASVRASSTTDTSGVTSIDDVTVSSSEVEEDIPGMQLLRSHYFDILQSLPLDHEKTLEILQGYFTDDEISTILSNSDCTVANKAILETLFTHFKATMNLKEFCDKLENITIISPQPEQLISVICKLKAVTHQDYPAQPGTVNNLAEADDKEMMIPEILSVSEDFSQLKAQFHNILQLMSDDYEQSVGKLQSHISDDQICDILCSSNCRIANNKILNCLIGKLSNKEDLLDLCDQLEKITTSHDLMVIIKDMKSDVEQCLQFSHMSDSNSSSLRHQLASSGISNEKFQLAFSNTSLDPDSKVVPILKRNFVGLCRCLPKDYMVTLERMKHKASISDGVALELAQLPTAEERNGMIIAMMLGPLDSDVEVLGFCDLLEDAVDSDSSMKFIHNLRAEVIEVLSTNDELQGHSQSSGLSADNEPSGDQCTSFFDRKIAQQMVAISPNSKALAVLRNNFTKLCHCLPDDYKQTISRIRRTATVQEGLVYQLALLPTAELANCTILAAMIRPLGKEIFLVGFCDSVKRLVDSAQSMEFIENLKKDVIAALTNQSSGDEVISLRTSTSGGQCISFFDQIIAPNMVALNPNSKVLAVLRKNFTHLCHCLPQNYKQTISKLKRTKIVSEDMVYRLSKLPSFELANCTILAGLIRHLKQEVDLLEFCDTIEDLTESKRFIDQLRNEIIEALELSGPTEASIVTTVNIIQPRAMISDVTTDVTFNRTQPVTNVPVDDVPVVTETMCTQPPSSDEELLGASHSTDPLLTTMVTATTTTAAAITTTSTTATTAPVFPVSPSDGNVTDYLLPEASDTTTHVTTDITTDTLQ